LDGREAERSGLFNKLCEPEQLLDDAIEAEAQVQAICR
jgi:hypothetical protein